MENKRIYISLPISGRDYDTQRDLAKAMEDKLRALGWDVFNPMGEQSARGLTTHEYMRIDISALLDCDAIILMKDWNRSAGCHTELCVAKAIGVEIYFEEQSNNLFNSYGNKGL